MPSLGVNIDHVATLRQARYRETPQSHNAEPDPVAAALVAEKAGAVGITAHLREDRRHIQDRDIFELRERITTKLNLEMGLSEDIVQIALRVKPQDVCLVPENRQEVTTEGGLDCAGQMGRLRVVVTQLQDAGARVSLFIDPEEHQLRAAAELRAGIVRMGALAGCWRAAPPAHPFFFFLSMAHTLPALPYGLDALEPHISRQTLEFHHGKHHNAYVTNLNNLVAGTELESKSLEDTITAVAGDASKAGVFNNAAQVWNHSFYWQCMKPGGGDRPTGALADKINADFGVEDRGSM